MFIDSEDFKIDSIKKKLEWTDKDAMLLEIQKFICIFSGKGVKCVQSSGVQFLCVCVSSFYEK